MPSSEHHAGANHQLMRALNRTLVLDLLRRRSPISRADLAKATGLAKPTISAIVDDLISEGVVRELGLRRAAGTGGRPPILLDFDATWSVVAGVRLSPDGTTVVAADARGSELAREQLPAPPADRPGVALRAVAAAVRRVVRRSGCPPERLAAVGVCLPGTVDALAGRCLVSAGLGWRDVAVGEPLQRAAGVPVLVRDAARCAAGAAAAAGTAPRDFLLLHFDADVTAAVVVDGRVYDGGSGRAGAVGHVAVAGAAGRCGCGGTGCLDTVAGSAALARELRRRLRAGERGHVARGRGGTVHAADLIAAAAAGDPLAVAVAGGAARHAGAALAWLVPLADPAEVLVAGPLAAAGEALLAPLREAVADSLRWTGRVIPVRPAGGGAEAELSGVVQAALSGSGTSYRVVTGR